jgi:hypothetical protein
VDVPGAGFSCTAGGISKLVRDSFFSESCADFAPGASVFASSPCFGCTWRSFWIFPSGVLSVTTGLTLGPFSSGPDGCESRIPTTWEFRRGSRI